MGVLLVSLFVAGADLVLSGPFMPCMATTSSMQE